MKFQKRKTIPYEGEMWSRTDLAEHLGITSGLLNSRISRGVPPALWAEPVKVENRNHKEPVPLTPLERANHKAYTDDELWTVYQFFRGQGNELTMLADFMGSDAEAASAKIVNWKREGRI